MRKRTSLTCLTLAACLALAGCGGAASAPSTSAAASVAASAAATPAATATPEPTATPDPEAQRLGQEICTDLNERYLAYARYIAPILADEGSEQFTIGNYSYFACTEGFSLESDVFPLIDALFAPEVAQERKDDLLAESTREFDVEQGDSAPAYVQREGKWYAPAYEPLPSVWVVDSAIVVAQEGDVYTVQVEWTPDDPTEGEAFPRDQFTAQQIDGVWYMVEYPSVVR